MSDPLNFIIGYVLLIFERKNDQGELGASLGELPRDRFHLKIKIT